MKCCILRCPNESDVPSKSRTSKPGKLQPGTTKLGNNNLGLGLANRVKDRVIVEDWV